MKNIWKYFDYFPLDKKQQQQQQQHQQQHVNSIGNVD